MKNPPRQSRLIKLISTRFWRKETWCVSSDRRSGEKRGLTLIDIVTDVEGINKAFGGIRRGKVGALAPAPPLKRMVAVPGWVVSTTRLVSKTNRHPRDNTPRDVCTTPITCIRVTLGRYIYISENDSSIIFENRNIRLL